jgi:hypothetical protein
MTDPRDTMRWLRRGAAIAMLVIGWVFIAWQNRFHVTAPMVFVCLAYLAVIATVYNLWRTGAIAADSSEDEGDSTWAKPLGALGELEREKRTLLKAIKEAEFDHQMGKLSQRDADEMIRGYRMRAIEVIKEIDRHGLGTAGSVREQILREVRARVQLEGKSPKVGKKAADAKAAKANGKRAAREDRATGGDAAGAEAAAAAPADGAETPGAGAANSSAAAPGTPPVSASPTVPGDDDLDADSTTALEDSAEDGSAAAPAHDAVAARDASGERREKEAAP